MSRLTRRDMLLRGLAAPVLLAGCDRAPEVLSRDGLLSVGEWLNYRASRLMGADTLVREYSFAEMSPEFRTNGTTLPTSEVYKRHLAESFTNWRLRIHGLVETPMEISLADLKRWPQRSQITRHDCVEGWSAIGQWRGTRFGPLLDHVGLKPKARFVVFHCADEIWGSPYYESIDLIDAFHPQTILAWEMNGSALPVGHGAPIRLRVERQLGYKHAKFVTRIEAVSDLSGIGQGRGGFWEDIGNYEWFAGI